jgi:hypothetical protein
MKVYGIRQLDCSGLSSYDIINEKGFNFYYVGTDLKDIERKVESNWTDLFETVYPYVALVTMDINTINSINDPIRIFEYQELTNEYKEVAYYNMLIKSDDDLGIKYL